MEIFNMNDKDFKKGSVEAFDSNWADRKETKYFHFNKNNPETQIQLAFSENFKLYILTKLFPIGKLVSNILIII